MTFTSWQFGVFAATVFAAYYLPALRSFQVQLLVFASLFFYGYGQPDLLALLAVAVFGTYLFLILALRNREVWLPVGIAFNLALLAILQIQVAVHRSGVSEPGRLRAARFPAETAAADRHFILCLPQHQPAGRPDPAEGGAADADRRLPLHHLLSATRFGPDHARGNVHAADQAEIFRGCSVRRGREMDPERIFLQALCRQQPQ